jgi:hypothetical protein
MRRLLVMRRCYFGRNDNIPKIIVQEFISEPAPLISAAGVWLVIITKLIF